MQQEKKERTTLKLNDMYVETMALDQVRVEIKKEEDYIHTKVYHMLNDDSKYKKLCMKIQDKEFHTFNMIDFVSKKSGLTYHIIPCTFGKRYYLKYGIEYLSYVTFRKYNKIWTCITGEIDVFVAPHFFDRYEERKDKNYESRFGLISEFFLSNQAMRAHEYNHPDHKNSLFFTLNDGVGFGTKLESSFLLSTFVREDMLFDNQTDLHTSEKRILDAIKCRLQQSPMEVFDEWKEYIFRN